MAPEFPFVASPELRTTKPDEPPAKPASDVLNNSVPLLNAPDPVTTDTLPPVAELDNPAKSEISPPVPLLPEPPVMYKDPPLPDDAAPVPRYTDPLFPFADPVLNNIVPLPPTGPESEVLRSIDPLEVVPYPEVIETRPPDNDKDSPADMTTSPPSPLFPEPTVTYTEPPRPDVDEPVPM